MGNIRGKTSFLHTFLCCVPCFNSGSCQGCSLEAVATWVYFSGLPNAHLDPPARLVDGRRQSPSAAAATVSEFHPLAPAADSLCPTSSVEQHRNQRQTGDAQQRQPYQLHLPQRRGSAYQRKWKSQLHNLNTVCTSIFSNDSSWKVKILKFDVLEFHEMKFTLSLSLSFS